MGWYRLIVVSLGLLLSLSWPGWAQADRLAMAHLDYGDRCLSEVQLGHYDEAIAVCTQAIHRDRAVDYRLSRGLAFYRSGQYLEALADNDQVLAIHPKDHRAYYNRGLVKVALHDFEAAIADFDRAAALVSAPHLLADIYDDRGLAKLMAAQPKAALQDFDRALAINNEDTRALFNHGCACHQLGRLDDALADLDQVLTLEPNQARHYLTRGLIRQAGGDRAGSLTDLQQAADCAHTHGQAHLRHYILSLLNEWQTPALSWG